MRLSTATFTGLQLRISSPQVKEQSQFWISRLSGRRLLFSSSIVGDSIRTLAGLHTPRWSSIAPTSRIIILCSCSSRISSWCSLRDGSTGGETGGQVAAGVEEGVGYSCGGGVLEQGGLLLRVLGVVAAWVTSGLN